MILYEAVLQGLITLGLAALGSLMLWRIYGKRIVAKAVTKHGSDALWDALEDMSKDPQHPSHRRIATFMGTQFAWLLDSIAVDLQSEEGREKYAPIFDFLWKFISASIYGSIGSFIKKAQTEGAAIGDMAQLEMPPVVTGLAQKFMPKRFKDADLDVGDLISAARWASQFLGSKGNGGSPTASSPFGSQGHHFSGGNGL